MKKKIITTLILIVIYIFSCVGSWYNLHTLFTNRWKNINPDGMASAVVFLPGLNTVSAIHYLIRIDDANKFLDIPNRN